MALDFMTFTLTSNPLFMALLLVRSWCLIFTLGNLSSCLPSYLNLPSSLFPPLNLPSFLSSFDVVSSFLFFLLLDLLSSLSSSLFSSSFIPTLSFPSSFPSCSRPPFPHSPSPYSKPLSSKLLPFPLVPPHPHHHHFLPSSLSLAALPTGQTRGVAKRHFNGLKCHATASAAALGGKKGRHSCELLR